MTHPDGRRRGFNFRLRPSEAIFFAFVHGAAMFATAAGPTTIDPYDVLEKSGHRKNLPRLLTTEDAGMSSFRPESLQPVEGDFDKDGRRDMAIAGVYNLPRNGARYFVLAVSDAADRARPILSEDGAVPFFLHPPGSTGSGDPADQAFSLSTCMNCPDGTDFRWDVRNKRFARSKWKSNRQAGQRPTAPAKPVEVSDENIDRALRIAGSLKDVQAFVAKLQSGGGKLGTRVEPIKNLASRVRVLIFEKRDDGEALYDAVDIDLVSEKVLGRKRR